MVEMCRTVERLCYQSINQSVNQSKHICIAPYVANESVALLCRVCLVG